LQKSDLNDQVSADHTSESVAARETLPKLL